jgi:hypothetical protein
VSNTSVIALNATLDLVALVAVFAVVRFTRRLHRYDHRAETVLPSQPIARRLALADHEVEELAEAA